MKTDSGLSAELMAECTVMLRDDLIQAGIVSEAVPAMMLTEAVLAHVAALRKDSEFVRGQRDEAIALAARAESIAKVARPQ